uniref:Uncharacterized protein n=1 Tax=viral metagenome TaxID=1070528 RepID=A0A6M3ISX2_9ZZZZ
MDVLKFIGVLLLFLGVLIGFYLLIGQSMYRYTKTYMKNLKKGSIVTDLNDESWIVEKVNQDGKTVDVVPFNYPRRNVRIKRRKRIDNLRPY